MEPLLGQIELLPYTFVPERWLACQGQLLPINQYQALFSLLGISFGGDGHSTFGLPDLRDKAPLPGLTYCMAVEGMYPRRPF